MFRVDIKRYNVGGADVTDWEWVRLGIYKTREEAEAAAEVFRMEYSFLYEYDPTSIEVEPYKFKFSSMPTFQLPPMVEFTPGYRPKVLRASEATEPGVYIDNGGVKRIAFSTEGISTYEELMTARRAAYFSRHRR